MRDSDDKLVLGVESLYVQARIAFSEAELLGSRERLRVGLPFFKDFREDVVGRAVEDAFYALDEIVVVVFFQIAQDGYAATNGAFVEHGTLVLLLQVVNFLK